MTVRFTVHTSGSTGGAEINEDVMRRWLKALGLSAQGIMGRGMGSAGGGPIYPELRTRGSGPGRQIFAIGPPPATRSSASLPGQYPAVQTGLLRSQSTSAAALDVDGGGSRYRLKWATPTPYAKWLAPAIELGEPRGPKRKFAGDAMEDALSRHPDPPPDIIRFTR